MFPDSEVVLVLRVKQVSNSAMSAVLIESGRNSLLLVVYLDIGDLDRVRETLFGRGPLVDSAKELGGGQRNDALVGAICGSGEGYKDR
jgi:hypothetical protein